MPRAEDNLLNLAADGELPQSKIRTKLRDIAATRDTLRAQLTTITDDLTAAARFIDDCLQLLTNPQELYRQANDEQRRQLNQAIFEKIYVFQDEITGHNLTEPFATLHAIHDTHRASLTQATPQNEGAARTGGSFLEAIHGVLARTDQVRGSSTTTMVGATGIEPVTSTVSR